MIDFFISDEQNWISIQNQLFLSNAKPQKQIPISVPSAATTISTTEILNGERAMASINQEYIEQQSLTTSIIQLTNNSNSSISTSRDIDTVNFIGINNSDNSSSLVNLPIKSTLMSFISTQEQQQNQQQSLPLQNLLNSNPKQPSKTESAMLNYLYDQYAPNKHKHYDFR